MKLPNYEYAIVPEAKITKYLLNESHSRGKTKAAFFLRFGFSISEWETMAEALVNHAAAYEVVGMLSTPEGIHYMVEGDLQTPDNRNPKVCVVWAIDTGSEMPRLVTTYPLKMKAK